jgi:Family of unknown function (DUF6151)
VAWGNQSDAPLDFSCSCGKLQGQIAGGAVANGSHVGCYCRDCRAAQLYLDQPDPAPGPVDLFLTTPQNVTITKGVEFLAPLRLSPRGPMRWRATCCDTPLCNTGPGPKIPFAAFQTATFVDADRIGPVIAKIYVPKPDGKSAHKGFSRVIVRLLPQMLASLVSGKWRNSPFFNTSTGATVAKPTVLTKEERTSLYR